MVQVAVEGVEQLETYFGAYLPQFFYTAILLFDLCMLLVSAMLYQSGKVDFAGVLVPVIVLFWLCCGACKSGKYAAEHFRSG